MFGVDDVALIFLVTTAANVAVEVGAEILAEWLLKSQRPAIDPSSFPSEQMAETGCAPAADGLFGTLADNVAYGVDCAAISVIDCIETCPVLLKLVAY